MTRHRAIPLRTLLLAAILAALLVFFAPASGAQTETTAPPVEQLPELIDETTDEDGDEKIVIAILMGLGIVILVLVAASLMSSNKKAPAPAPARAPTPAAPSPKRQLLGNIQWLHDQLSLELLSGSAEQAKLRWASERGRADNMSIQCQQIAASGAGPVWQRLAGSISSLSSALDTAINLRADEQADPAIVREAINVVNRNRNEMQPLITTASYA